MLFSQEESKHLSRAITSFVNSLPAEEQTEYVLTITSQLIGAITARLALQISDTGQDVFGKFTSEIRAALVDHVSLGNIEDAHFAFARLLRFASFGGHQDFSEYPVVDFYLNPKFREIQQRRIDKIRFEIPSDYVLQPYKDGLEKTVKHVDTLRQWEDKLLAWQKDVEGKLQAWQDRADDTEKRYKNVVEGQNYLGLAQAFVNLIAQKQAELKNTWQVLCWIGVAVLLVPVVYLVIGNSEALLTFFAGTASFSSVSIFVFSVVLEALLLYYFRIAYSQWSAIKHQILQLSLRHQMCAFANEYAHSSNGMDRNTLSKFENLVFSELSQDSNTPPSVYDAVDSIAKVIGSVRSGKTGP